MLVKPDEAGGGGGGGNGGGGGSSRPEGTRDRIACGLPNYEGRREGQILSDPGFRESRDHSFARPPVH